MKRTLVFLAILIGLLIAPSSSQAARSCGNISSGAGPARQVATWRVPCREARQVGEGFVERSKNWTRRGTTYVRGWRCRSGNTILGFCDRYQRGVWVLLQTGQSVSHLKVRRPRLDHYFADRLTRRAMRLKYGDTWRYAYSNRVRCKPLGRLNQRCAATFGIGDSVYFVSARVRLRPRLHSDQTIVRGRTSRLNEYCAIVLEKPLSSCISKHRFGPITSQWD
jgi:hypothetical protein